MDKLLFLMSDLENLKKFRQIFRVRNSRTETYLRRLFIKLSFSLINSKMNQFLKMIVNFLLFYGCETLNLHVKNIGDSPLNYLSNESK